ncbi:hypothetical protein Tco_0750678 [Tanacetum coccineum]|uniref:Uncharacterized protein n=1 Tax=Tanacetum coccineum TaxID=301880 RepID=A0ABQ4Z2Q6_9ASTR
MMTSLTSLNTKNRKEALTPSIVGLKLCKGTCHEYECLEFGELVPPPDNAFVNFLLSGSDKVKLVHRLVMYSEKQGSVGRCRGLSSKKMVLISKSHSLSVAR